MRNAWDHPRLRGEHADKDNKSECCRGSPPPTRGTQRCITCRYVCFRITPAYAGNTDILPFSSVDIRDHPRLRGEHFVHCIDGQIIEGSPPPTRGTLPILLPILSQTGITPAYAGNTQPLACKHRTIRDHPRLRGEHRQRQHTTEQYRGSPPPTRGTLNCARIYSAHIRITPAYAGNTVIRSLKQAMSDYINP